VAHLLLAQLLLVMAAQAVQDHQAALVVQQ
jgi:hypothetical protein